MLVRALVIDEKSLGLHNPALADTLVSLGLAELEMGNSNEAVAALERALRVRPLAQSAPKEQGDVQFALARALRSAGQPERSRALAVGATEAFGRMGEFGQVRAAAVSAWSARPKI